MRPEQQDPRALRFNPARRMASSRGGAPAAVDEGDAKDSECGADLVTDYLSYGSDGDDGGGWREGGVEFPPKFNKTGRRGLCASSGSARPTKLEWASYGADGAGLGEEVMNVNEHASEVESCTIAFISQIRSAATTEQLATVPASVFAPGAGSTSPGAPGGSSDAPPQAAQSARPPPPRHRGPSMGSPIVLVAPSESMTIDGRVTLVRCEPPNLANSMVSLRAQSFDRCPPVCDPLHLKATTPHLLLPTGRCSRSRRSQGQWRRRRRWWRRRRRR